MIENFEQLIKSQYFKSTANNLMLKDNQSRMRVAVTGVPENGFLFNIPPQGIAHSVIVQDKIGYRKTCDKLLLIHHQNRIDAYFIELKMSINGDQSIEDACDQIISTIPVMKYIESMLNIHFQSKQIIKDYYVVIAKRSVPRFDTQRIKHLERKKITYKHKEFRVIHSIEPIPLEMLR